MQYASTTEWKRGGGRDGKSCFGVIVWYPQRVIFAESMFCMLVAHSCCLLGGGGVDVVEKVRLCLIPESERRGQ